MSGDSDRALHALIDLLRALRYSFVTPTPLTHARVLARKDAGARDLRDVFGWSLPFHPAVMPEEIVRLLDMGGALDRRGDLLSSSVRVSTLGDDYFLHSAFPTTAQDSVFFGPDSYRFSDFLRAELPRLAPRKHVVDIGTGAGVGAIAAARCLPEGYITLTDINRAALRLAAINWMANDFPFGGVMFKQGDGLLNVGDPERPIDCIIANPPYIADPAHRAYRDGGGMHGAAVSLAWARAAAERLTRGGAFLLYTGSAIVNGEDRLRTALFETLRNFDVTYREIDPDVFGEELERADYADVERIAVVGVVAVRR